MTTQFDQYSDLIDSRDVIERLQELERWSECDVCGEVCGLAPAGSGFAWMHAHSKDAYCGTGDGATASPSPLDADESDELIALRQLIEELRDVGVDEPEDGLTLVRDSYFTEYARELAEELDLIPSEYTWPTSCIDWQHAALELRMDYTPVEFRGVTYWTR